MIKYFTVILFILIICSPLLAGTDSADGDSGKSLLELFVVEGGPIVWYVLIPMSVLMMFVVSYLFFSFRRSKLLADGVSGEIIIAAKRGNMASLSGNDDLISKVMSRVAVKAKHLGGDKKYMHELAKEALHEQGLELMRKVEWCGIIGNVAPMVGLFGTVYGMIQAFDLLGAAGGQPRADQLAAKISIALVTTFWGLLVAIPALVIGGVFRSRIEAIVSEAGVEIEGIIGELFRKESSSNSVNGKS